MSSFGLYAQCYDLLYRDKDYRAECAYVHGLLRDHGGIPGNMLDVGCGTGRHAEQFARLGYRVTGLDLSEPMLALAGIRREALEPELRSRLHFLAGDARNFRLPQTYRAVTALFHVMSYQAGEGDLGDALAAVAAHLEAGGLFVFDCWYGPAVEADPPHVRVRHIEDETISAVRTARPTCLPDRNQVQVDFHLEITDKVSGEVRRLDETHLLRYLFRDEVEALLPAHGLDLVAAHRWMSDAPPSADHWYACFVARKR